MEELKIDQSLCLVIDQALNLITHGVQGDATVQSGKARCYEMYGRPGPCSWCQRAHATRAKTPLRVLVDMDGAMRQFAWVPLTNDKCLCMSNHHSADAPGEAGEGIRLMRASETTLRKQMDMEMLVAQVCHDLRSPLFTMKGFLGIFMEAEEVRALPETRQRQLQRVWESAKRLESTMTATIDYIGLTEDKLRVTTVDLSCMAREIVQELQALEPRRQADIRIIESAPVQGDENLMFRLMENLLGNAWKYTAQKPLSRIEFGCSRDDGQRAFFIRDNGVGFDVAHSDRIFKPFQRLQPTDTFPGTGLGLASVRRIIDLHRGAVWCDAVDGHGATFYFSLPEHDA